MNKLALIFDLETTGLSLPNLARIEQQPRIIELGAVMVDGTGKVYAELSELINPGGPISDEITKITGS